MSRISESRSLGIADKDNQAFISRFTDLKVFRKAFEISLIVHKMSLAFPKIEQYGGLADQMRRASKGICANIGEGFAKQQRSKAEFKRFLLMALGSAQEIRVWVEYCRELEYINSEIA